MATSEAIRKRIDGLLAKTVANGATEEEEMIAMAKAMELIAKYQVDMTKESAKKQGVKIDKLVFEIPLAQFAAWEMMPAVQIAADVKAFRRGKANYYMIGLEEDVAFAKWLWLNLVTFSINSVNTWWRDPKNYMPSSVVGTAARRTKIKQSFIKGMSERVQIRAAEEKEKIASTGRSLVLVKKDVIDDFMNEHKIAPKKVSDRKKYEMWAEQSGYEEGNKAQLRKVKELNDGP